MEPGCRSQVKILGSRREWELGVEDCFLEWHAREDEDREKPIGQRVFGAGLTLVGHKMHFEHVQEWLDGLAVRGFEWSVPARGDPGRRYLFRYKYPAELVGAASLQAQGEALAAWVAESFELIATWPSRRLPPRV